MLPCCSILGCNDYFHEFLNDMIEDEAVSFRGVLFLKLPNTKSVCRISCRQFYRPDNKKDSDDTLYPDVPVYKTYMSIMDGTDPAYEWIMKQNDL